MNYYNEFDKDAADHLEDLIAGGDIAPGHVDRRSIVDVQAGDLAGYTQCHFFCGIGGWPLALRMAEWPDTREIWTGSAPCQPFSIIGKQLGILDERHLWPHQHRLIRACWPAVFMGEQVADAIKKHWLDGVLLDLEREGYACGAVVLPACAVDSPQRRDRIYFIGDGYGAVGNAKRAGLERHAGNGDDAREGPVADRPVSAPGIRGRSAWADAEWIEGHDGKRRRSKSGAVLLGYGVPGYVAAVRGFGNAIVPPLAAEVIKAYMDSTA